MFFNRFGKQALLSHPASSSDKTPPKSKSFENAEGTARRRAVAVALAVQFALPMGMVSRTAWVRADDMAPATGPASAPTAAAPASAPAAAAPAPAATAAPASTVVATPAAPAASGEDAAARAALDANAKVQNIQHQKDAFDAQKLVEKARGEQTAGQYTDALRDYGSAVKLDSTNEQAKAGYDEVAERLGVVRQMPGADRQANAIQVKIREITYHFNTALDNAEQDITAAKFSDAQKDIEQAQRWRNDDPSLFQQSQMNDFDTRIEQTRIHLETAKSGTIQIDEQKARENAEKEEHLRAERFQADREKTIAGLIQDARNYYDEGKYTEALAVIDNIQRIDPTNSYAGDVRQMVADKALTAEQKKYKEDFDTNYAHVLNAAVEKKIPYEDIVRYSPDWPKISAERDEEVKADRGEDTEDATLQAQLDHHIPDLHFNASSLSEVIDFLRDVTGTNIYVDWAALERANIAKDAPVTARLRDIRFSKALELIFKSVETADVKLGYTLDEGVITISTMTELNKNTVVRKYDINDLLFVPTDAKAAPSLSLTNSGQSGGGGGGGASGGGGGGGGGSQQSLFTGDTGGQSQQANTTDRANRVDEIKKYITDNVDTTTWKDNGGDVGSISSSPLRAVLLVTQTPEAHRKIQSVLDSLRSSQALQVSVETRFLTVQRNYLEDIGVNASFEFNPLRDPTNPRSGVNNSRFQPISITQNQASDNSTFRDANGNVVSNPTVGSRTLDWVSNVANASVPGSIPANTADYPNPLVVSGSYMDNFTVNFLVRAVQANINTTTLTAPRITLFSGQSSLLVVETQQAYVGGLTPVVANGAALFNPTINLALSGVVLFVQATVSPDRKYVFMNLSPSLSRLRALVPFSVSSVVTPPVTVIGVVPTPTIITGTLQLPTNDIDLVQTSCSVPDGATLLLGGQTLAGDNTREQGVPVLSKIPFLKRLFTNRAQAQDESILLILVKPTILIQGEQELKQFPQLSSKLK